jgi:hypothetical protein
MKRHVALLIPWLLVAALAAQVRASVAVEDEEIVFRVRGVEAGKVYLVGDFNGWNPTIDLMVGIEGGFEIRLFLLPGAYRYGFIADGVSMADPDNPCVDANGRSCFVLVERDGVLEVVLAESAVRPGVSASSSLVPTVMIDAVARGNDGSLYSSWEIAGTVDKRIDVDLAAGMRGTLAEGEEGEGDAFLLRGLGAYRFEHGMIRAFTRPSSPIDLGDSIGIVGTIGPYRYPLSLFCRGAEMEGSFPLGLEGRFLYASRLRGYRSGLEGMIDSTDLFSRRDLVGSDLYGLGIGARIRSAGVRYLFRENRRRMDGYWRFPTDGGDLNAGFERDIFQGLSLSLPPSDGVVLDGEMLFGRSFLSATGRLRADTEGRDRIEDLSVEHEWERGSRLSIGISRAGGRSRAALRFDRTTLEGAREARGGRPEGSRDALAGSFVFGDSTLSVGLSGKLELYSTMNTGSTFWLARTNFWLDGDELTCALVPFLSSSQVGEMKLSLSWRREQPGDLPWGTGLLCEITSRWDGTSGGPRFGEIHLVNGVAVHPRAAVLLDMRGVSYDYGGVGRTFVDAFLSLRASIGKRLWCAVGTGVNPYGFDRWLYAFSDHGREEYLLERGVFSSLVSGGEAASMRTLLDGEESLAEDRVVSVEAGFTF